MSFAPDFAFYRDDRPIGRDPPNAFWDAMKLEAHQLFTQRQLTLPGLAAKGRIRHQDAERQIRVARANAEAWGVLPASPGFPLATWSELIHDLRHEITRRRQHYPQWVAAGQLDPAEAERRLLLLEQWHDSLWHTCNRPEAIAARAALAAAQARRPAA